MRISIVLVAVFFTCVGGCGRGPKGPPREATYPIIGTVLVDGEPASNLKVTCHPNSESSSQRSLGGYTDVAGNFAIGTYEAGDGAPVGTYKLTFVWGKIDLLSGKYGGPDKLNGRYTDVESSDFTVTVKENESCDIGVLTLSTKDDD